MNRIESIGREWEDNCEAARSQNEEAAEFRQLRIEEVATEIWADPGRL